MLTFEKLRNVDPPTVRLTWTAVSTPTPDYDVYQITTFSNKCPSTTAPGWKEIANGLTSTQLDVTIPIVGSTTPDGYCWYVQGYVNGAPTAPSNAFFGWIAVVGYMYFHYIPADAISGGCPTDFTVGPKVPYPYSSGGSFTITQTLNGMTSVLSSVRPPRFARNLAGQATDEFFEWQVNVLDSATYTGTATFPDGYTYTFPMFTDWAQTLGSTDDYDIWDLTKLEGSGTICRRGLYQYEQPTE